MARHSIRYGAILLASVAALAMPVAAQAAFGGGHGGGFGGGHAGGGFGGGHIGGFGGGHIGGFGGAHIGGLGGARFGGARLGGARIGGTHFGGARLGGAHVGGNRFAHGGLGGHLAAGPHGGRVGGLNRGGLDHGAQHGALERDGLGRRAERGAFKRGVGGRNFGMASRNATRMAARGDFSRGRWNRFRGGFGWAGPVFWPYAYSDIYDDVFWGYPYDPFWDYGYGDIYGALFSPYGYDDLAGFLGGGGYGYAGGGRVASRGNYRGAEPGGQLAGQLGAMCGDDSRAVAEYPTTRIGELIAPADQAQRDALDALASASVKAAQIVKAACPSSVPFTPIGRMDAMEARLAAMAQAVDAVRGPLDRFYATLSDEQKARLNAAQANDQTRTRSVVENCNAVTTETQWPGAQIERAVRPTPAEQASLNALRDVVNKAANELAASCPSALPVTPPARLDAIAKRLEAMRHAVGEVRTALGNFYGSLSDEQKAQFNMIGQPRAAQR
jgi:LTXXQ motif family protein